MALLIWVSSRANVNFGLITPPSAGVSPPNQIFCINEPAIDFATLLGAPDPNGTWTDPASITSNPAKILGINKGSLEKGNEADLCVFDINKPWVVNKDKLQSKSKNTPIEDRKLQGQVLKTFIKGEMAFERV